MTIDFYFDIETIPDQDPDAFEKYLDAVEPPGNIKKEDTKAKWMLENSESVALENFKKTALTGLHGEICSIAWAVDDGDVKCHTRIRGETETDLLNAFWTNIVQDVKAVAVGDPNWPRLEWIGHNVIDFDLRFLKQRGIVNRIPPLFPIPADARHGSGRAFDTMKEWSGWRGYVKQDELVEALGIKKPDWIDDDILTIDGSKVWELWQDEEFGLITEYNRLDVYYVREIHRRMQFRDYEE
jgi:hypothetical protein